MKTYEHLLFICILSSIILPSKENAREVFYSKLIDFLFENYPNFMERLLTYNGTSFGLNSSIVQSNLYNGYAMEVKYKDGYSILLANSYRQRFKNGIFESSTQVHNTLYRCNSAIHYCSGDPSYCFYDEGEEGTKLIVVAGHGGPLRPKGIPDREAGCWVPKTQTCIYRHGCENVDENIFKSEEYCSTKDEDDVETTDLAESLVHSIQRLSGSRPHLIVNRVHRAKIDVNRELSLGTFHVPEAEQAYKDFHKFIKTARQSFDGKWGLLLDIHGNSRGPWTMLGYGMYKYQFEYKTLNPNDSSIQRLADHVNNVTFDSLLLGNNSLGYFIEDAGGKVFPSPSNPDPANKGYLTGGYITQYHGSKHGGNVDAIQMEIPTSVRENPDEELAYINKISQAIVKYIDVNYYKFGKKS